MASAFVVFVTFSSGTDNFEPFPLVSVLIDASTQACSTHYLQRTYVCSILALPVARHTPISRIICRRFMNNIVDFADFDNNWFDGSRCTCH
ncbi:hypothetical protein HOLleu_05240 [Holothuria leucospilota]|uniref:Uncharacterized protein n=1 Tax=Holothuria leucospilota TaxID=206669 RepID=A0A9Q1HHA2_HOLLE|nr:hypothetical protein HOLleu_05240 [Holothuria leucospilota]